VFGLIYLVCDPISFVGDPWRATTDLVRGAFLYYALSLSPMHIVGGIDILHLCLFPERKLSIS